MTAVCTIQAMTEALDRCVFVDIQIVTIVMFKLSDESIFIQGVLQGDEQIQNTGNNSEDVRPPKGARPPLPDRRVPYKISIMQVV